MLKFLNFWQIYHLIISQKLTLLNYSPYSWCLSKYTFLYYGVSVNQSIASCNKLGDNCIQKFHLGRYIVGYTVVLRQRASGAIKRDFKRISGNIPPQMKILNMVIPISNALLQFDLKLERCKPHKAARHPTKGDVIDDVNLFLTVWSRIYCRKFFKVIQSDVALQTWVH